MSAQQPSVKTQRLRELEVKAREHQCPQCGALAGEPCLKDAGAPAPKTHAIRVRLASYKPVA